MHRLSSHQPPRSDQQRLLEEKVLMKHLKVLLLHWSMVLLVYLKCMDDEYEILGQSGPHHHLHLQMAWLLLWLIAFHML
uniref:Uncharacterized protein n=1 Tax=Arundo donax TaxID=35708 RepID=A0A0A9AUL5_ARUDO